MAYVLGQKSRANLAGVHPDLMRIIELAITLSDQDFGVTERQVRTLEYQKQLVARGVSKTLKSNHLEQVDLTGKTTNKYGHAVDLVPYVDGKFVWEWRYIFPIASAMVKAARQLKLDGQLCWGGVWDRWMNQYSSNDASAQAMQAAELAYCVRHPGPDFVDGPHFQLYKKG